MTEHLQEQLQQLRQQLADGSPLSDEERTSLVELANEVELQQSLAAGTADPSVVDGVNLAVERFEVEHPTLAGTLRNIVQSLANMGI